MSKGLEALKILSDVASMYCDECATSEEDLDRGMFEKDYQAVKTIEKELKALEIIVKKANIRLYHLNTSDRYYFRTTNHLYEISKEKYDLLKEVLL